MSRRGKSVICELFAPRLRSARACVKIRERKPEGSEPMKLTFIRADHEVTGSCTLLEIGGHYGLIDCGMEQGRDLFENIAIPVPAAQIEFVLVTHAHMDHTGHLPLLYKQGFRGTVYATEATCDLCGIMLRDAAHIQMTEAEWTI